VLCPELFEFLFSGLASGFNPQQALFFHGNLMFFFPHDKSASVDFEILVFEISLVL
jgi:hypothetical protein